MVKRHKAQRHGHAHRRSGKLWWLAGLVADWHERRTRVDEYAEDAPVYL